MNKNKHGLRNFFRGLLVCVLLLIIAAAIVWRLTWVDPVWYQPPPDTQATQDLADRVEYRMIEEAQRIRSAEEGWTVRIREDQVNAWLASRLPRWIQHEQNLEWPAQLGVVQVRLVDDAIDVAVEILAEEDDATRIVVLRVVPVVTEQGITVELERVGSGRVLLPGDPVSYITDTLDKLLEKGAIDSGMYQFVTEFIMGEHPIDRILTLADKRRLRIDGLEYHEGSVDVTLHTLAAE